MTLNFHVFRHQSWQNVSTNHFFSHLLPALCLCGLSVRVMFCLYNHQWVGFRGNHKSTGRVLQSGWRLIENSTQLLQCQNAAEKTTNICFTKSLVQVTKLSCGFTDCIQGISWVVCRTYSHWHMESLPASDWSFKWQHHTSNNDLTHWVVSTCTKQQQGNRC